MIPVQLRLGTVPDIIQSEMQISCLDYVEVRRISVENCAGIRYVITSHASNTYDWYQVWLYH